MDVLKLRKAQNREKSRNTTNVYYGPVPELVKELEENDPKQRIRTFSQDTYNDVLYALRLINCIYDAAVVIHGPRGCGAVQPYFDFSLNTNVKWSVTNLGEHDSIMGSDVKLREAVVSLHRKFKPEIVFIVATPVVAINNDDIQSVSEELQEELGISIIPIYTDGFKPRTPLAGYDIVFNALVSSLLGDKKKTANLINILSVSESAADLGEVKRLAEQLGVETNILPKFANTKSFTDAAAARISVSVNPDESYLLGTAIKDKYEIEYLQPGLPIGFKGTSRWLEAIGNALDVKDEAGALVDRETRELKTLIQDYSLKNLKVYISLPTRYALGIAEYIEELGGEVIGLTISHADKLNYNELKEIASAYYGKLLHIAEGQPFEEANILKKSKPDIYIGGEGKLQAAIKLGIPAVYVGDGHVLGFKGAYELVRRLAKALSNKGYVQNIAKAAVLPYQDSWYQKKPNWFIKQEVK